MNKIYQKSPGGAKNAGFTLIELLVVVLIIGILAAVALPQYEKAVEKSRAAEAMVILKSIADANNVYYLANGNYAVHIDDLDVEIPGEDKVFNTWRRKQSKNYQFGTQAQSVTASIALANRLPFGGVYYMYILRDQPGVYCKGYTAKGTEICRALSNGNASGDRFLIN